MHPVGCAECIAFDGLRQGEPLLGNPSARRFAIASLSRDRGLNSLPRIKRHYRPVTAKSFVPASFRNALPCPRSRLAITPCILQPNFEHIVIRISVQRLKASDHIELAKSRD